jgi:hypothetical protein
MSKPKMIPVATWAASRYDPVPSDWVLRRWCREGQIYPAPERVGKEWRVLETARRLTGDAPARGSLLEQMGAA